MTPDPGTPSSPSAATGASPASPPPGVGAGDREPHLRDAQPLILAAIRTTIAIEEITALFDRAFHTVMTAIQHQGVHPVGPPVGVYYGMPSETVDLAAGFPVSAAILPDGDVRPVELPGGRVAEMLHRGTYDSMAASYQRLEDWMRAEGLTAAPMVWETYLTEPSPGGDPDATLTLITWPLVEPGSVPEPSSL